MINSEQLRRDAKGLEYKMHELECYMRDFIYKCESVLSHGGDCALDEGYRSLKKTIDIISHELDDVLILLDSSVVYGPEPVSELPVDIELK